jgi:hypothetical protein
MPRAKEILPRGILGTRDVCSSAVLYTLRGVKETLSTERDHTRAEVQRAGTGGQQVLSPLQDEIVSDLKTQSVPNSLLRV